jgi:hypothetical protein
MLLTGLGIDITYTVSAETPSIISIIFEAVPKCQILEQLPWI